VKTLRGRPSTEYKGKPQLPERLKKRDETMRRNAEGIKEAAQEDPPWSRNRMLPFRFIVPLFHSGLPWWRYLKTAPERKIVPLPAPAV
jgi:hypothetical protein